MTEPTGPNETTFFGKVNRPGSLRVVVVLAVAVALLVGAAVTMGASPSPSSEASPEPSAKASNDPGKANPGGPGGGRFGGPGAFGIRGGIGFGQITITAVDGSNLSLKTADGWTRTIVVTDATTITKGGQTIAAGDLAVGDEIRFSQTRNADGSYTVNAIVVVVPRVAGIVTAVTDSNFTIRTRDGSTTTVAVTGSTTYSVGQKAGTKADLVVGATVGAAGTRAADGAFTATAVTIAPSIVGGVVTAKTDSTITIRRADGTSATLNVGSDTTYRIAGTNNATLANVTVGMAIAAQVTANADGTFDALVVATRGGRGGFPGGRGGQNGPNASPSPGTNG